MAECGHPVMQAWCIMREMSSLIYNASEDQIMRARNQLKASMLFAQDNPGGALMMRPLLEQTHKGSWTPAIPHAPNSCLKEMTFPSTAGIRGVLETLPCSAALLTKQNELPK